MGGIFDFLFGGEKKAEAPVTTTTPGYRLPGNYLEQALQDLFKLINPAMAAAGGLGGGGSPFNTLAGDVLLGLLPQDFVAQFLSGQKQGTTTTTKTTGTPSQPPAGAKWTTNWLSQIMGGKGGENNWLSQMMGGKHKTVPTTATGTTGETTTTTTSGGNDWFTPLALGASPAMKAFSDLVGTVMGGAERAYRPVVSGIGNEFVGKGLGQSVRGAAMQKEAATDVVQRMAETMGQIGVGLAPTISQYPLMIASALQNFGQSQSTIDPRNKDLINILMQIMGTGAGSPTTTSYQPTYGKTTGLLETLLPYLLMAGSGGAAAGAGTLFGNADYMAGLA